jgi:hypothetical protein
MLQYIAATALGMSLVCIGRIESGDGSAEAVELNVCEVLLEDLLLPAQFEEITECVRDWKVLLLMPHCALPSCMIHPECVITRTILTAAEELLRAGEVHCSLRDISPEAFLEKWVRGLIANTADLILGGLPHAILSGIKHHFELLAARGSSLPPAVQQILNAIADRGPEVGLESFTSRDVHDIRIISSTEPDASLYLLEGVAAITLGPVIVVQDEHFQALVHATNNAVTLENMLAGTLPTALVRAIDLMVHELIHVRQFRELGAETFIKNYYLEAAVSGGYGSDSFEREAFTFAATMADLHEGHYCSATRAAHNSDINAFQLEIPLLTCTAHPPTLLPLLVGLLD